MSAEIAYAAAEKAEVLITLRRYAEARAILGAAVAAAPEEPALWHLLAQACPSAQDHRAALEAADRGVALDPEDEWGHRLRSHALQRLGRHQEAITAAQDAVRAAPYSWAAHARFADVISADVENHPGDAWSGRALDAARRAVELAPHEARAYEALAQVHAQRREWRDMAAAETGALALAPEDADLHNDLAIIRMNVEHPVQAGAGFARAAALDPRGPGARNFGILARALFDHRIKKAVFALWVAGFVARGAGAGSPDLKLRFWAAAAVLTIGWFLLKPVAEFVREVGPRYRRAMASAVLRNRRLAVQSAALATAWILCAASVALPAAVIRVTVTAAVACYFVTAVLTWFDRKGNRIVDPKAPRR